MKVCVLMFKSKSSVIVVDVALTAALAVEVNALPKQLNELDDSGRVITLSLSRSHVAGT